MAYLPPKLLERKLLQFLQEDLEFGDITTEITPDKIVNANLIAKEHGFVSGLEFARILVNVVGLEIKTNRNDGEQIKQGDIIFTIKGSSRAILVVERTLLNIIMRLSGITTQTKNLVNMISNSKLSIKVASTRKTTPGFRYFEKYAVKTGGGDTHRWSLSDEILIKENHLALFKGELIDEILRKYQQQTSFTRKIDIEVTTLEEFEKVLNIHPDIIMLDNFTPEKIHQAIALMNDRISGRKPLIEISGGINPENLEKYLINGVDIISIGALTHTVRSLDFSLKIQT
ncbi:MAG: carboxylating nicotinate-nucleotide diphosphorylase [Candidatus Hodarchaeales archaeon]|jgi:nicotinate-nucleotide pyrophosphorylase (carboxylating)